LGGLAVICAENRTNIAFRLKNRAIRKKCGNLLVETWQLVVRDGLAREADLVPGDEHLLAISLGDQIPLRERKII
jgi:hypothetical protein